jgi:putative effector of murein hydrolase LrgA (UPF0299 family)
MLMSISDVIGLILVLVCLIYKYFNTHNFSKQHNVVYIYNVAYVFVLVGSIIGMSILKVELQNESIYKLQMNFMVSFMQSYP